jgi:hypothetical protein
VPVHCQELVESHLATLWPPTTCPPPMVQRASQKSSERDSDLSLPAPALVGTLSRMTVVSNRIPQPGGTGNVGALRILKAVRRASPVDPIGHRSMAASVRTGDSLTRRSTVRVSPPVSVGLRTIETGVARLAQCQAPCAFAPNRLRCKSPQIRLFGGSIAKRCRRPRLIRDRRNGERPETSSGARQDRHRSSLSRCRKEAAARLCDNDRARPALHPV